MFFPKKALSLIIIYCVLIHSPSVRAESVDEKFTQITPSERLAGGEFIHGSGYGKLLMRILMFGAISSQGIHYVPEGTDLMFAVLYAGGLGETTKWNGITIRRRGEKELIEVDLEDLFEDGEPIPKLQDGDIINVPWNVRKYISEFFYWTGAVTGIVGVTLGVIALTRR